jgi:hypothetical protein
MLGILSIKDQLEMNVRTMMNVMVKELAGLDSVEENQDQKKINIIFMINRDYWEQMRCSKPK